MTVWHQCGAARSSWGHFSQTYLILYGDPRSALWLVCVHYGLDWLSTTFKNIVLKVWFIIVSMWNSSSDRDNRRIWRLRKNKEKMAMTLPHPPSNIWDSCESQISGCRYGRYSSDFILAALMLEEVEEAREEMMIHVGEELVKTYCEYMGIQRFKRQGGLCMSTPKWVLHQNLFASTNAYNMHLKLSTAFCLINIPPWYDSLIQHPLREPVLAYFITKLELTQLIPLTWCSKIGFQ